MRSKATNVSSLKTGLKIVCRTGDMATCLADDRRDSPSASARSSGRYRTKLKVLSTPPKFELDRVELLEGSGQWENIQDVLRRCNNKNHSRLLMKDSECEEAVESSPLGTIPS